MKIARFRVDAKTAYGSVQGNRVVRLSGSPFAGKPKLTKESYALSKVKLLVPGEPTMLWASSTTMYESHSRWVAQMWPYRAVPAPANRPPRSTGPQVDYRVVSAMIPTEQPIVLPRDAKLVHWEAEVVTVIGRRCKGVSVKEAPDYILGYALGNDVSERIWQEADASFWRAKNSDTFKPVGPWVVTDLDFRDITVITRVNGKEVQRYRTADAKFTPAEFVSAMSQYMTLNAGDMIYMGAEGAPGEIRDGDTVEIESPSIGVLRNPVVRAK